MDHDNSLQEVMTRTSLSHSNQMEMLTFRLTDGQLYGINVFKIIEIVECPGRLDRIPYSHPSVKGIVDFRGQAITVIDLSEAVGLPSVNYKTDLAYLVVCEYNKQLNAFLVATPEVLLTRSWQDIKKPDGIDAPALVAIAYNDTNEMVLLLDIEGILAEVIGLEGGIEEQVLEHAEHVCQGKHILIVDDSNAALTLMRKTLTDSGMKVTEFSSAVRALESLSPPQQQEAADFDVIISDIEMPGMDGFTFTRTLKTLSRFEHVPVILHSSMSNPTNEIKAREAGATAFIAKFDPNVLVGRIAQLIQSR
nr:chemotaxis protein [uncultured Desulfuromonas sp.]